MRTLASLAFLLVSCCVFIANTAYPESGTESDPCVPAWNLFAGNDKISSTVLSSLKSKDGIIYIGGRDGLYRMEGGNVHFWYPDFTDPSALPSGNVRALAQGGSHIWVGSNSGLSQLDPKTGVFERNSAINRLIDNQPVFSLVTHNNHVFVGTAKGLFTIQLHNEIDQLRVVSSNLDTGTVFDLIQLDNRIIAATDTGLWEIPTTLLPRKLPLDISDLKSLSANKHGLWTISSDKLYRINLSNNDFVSFTTALTPELPQSNLSVIESDREGRLWIASDKGLSRWNFEYDQPSACHISLGNSGENTDPSISHMSSQLGQYFFLGTRGQGAIIAPLSKAVRVVSPGGKYNKGLDQSVIWSHTFDSDHRLVLGTANGVYIETGVKQGHFTRIDHGPLNEQRIYSVFESEPDKLWIGSRRGLYVKHRDTLQHIDLLVDEKGEVVDPAIFSIKPLNDLIVLGTSRGLVAIDSKTYQVRSLFKTRNDIFSVNNSDEQLINASRLWSVDIFNQRVFAAGNDGAYELDLVNNRIVNSLQKSEKSSRPSVGYIYTIIVQNENQLLLGTEAGLVQTNSQFTEFNKINDINSKKLNAVMSSVRADNGDLWLGVAATGLFHFDTSTQTWRHITQSDGLITNGASQLGLSYAQNQYITVSNATGLSAIDLSEFSTNNTELNQLRLKDAAKNLIISEQEPYHLNPSTRDLKLSFITTDLIEMDIYTVHYELITPTGEIRNEIVYLDESLSFINLLPGAYSLSAALRSTSGNRSAESRYSFVVEPRWWETFWFNLVLLAILMSLIIIAVYTRKRLIDARFKLISDERKRIAQDLHDSSLQDLFGIKMIGRTIELDVLSTTDKQVLDRQAGLVDRAIDSLRKSVSSISELTDVPPLNQAIFDVQDNLTVPDTINFSVESVGTPWRIGLQRRFFIYRIVREAANNACKHCGGTQVNVLMTWTPIRLLIDIKDNGIGFDTRCCPNRDTYGLRSMKSMADAAKIRVKIHSHIGKGAYVDKGTHIQLKVNRFYL